MVPVSFFPQTHVQLFHKFWAILVRMSDPLLTHASAQTLAGKTLLETTSPCEIFTGPWGLFC